MNKFFISGNLGSDPEQAVSANGTSYVKLNLFHNRPVKQQDGTYTDKLVPFRFVVAGNQGNYVFNHAKKGTQLFVEGHFDSYAKVNPETNKTYMELSMNVDKVEIGARGVFNNSAAAGNGFTAAPVQNAALQQQPMNQPMNNGGFVQQQPMNQPMNNGYAQNSNNANNGGFIDMSNISDMDLPFN